jgi:hypothetical protein
MTNTWWLHDEKQLVTQIGILALIAKNPKSFASKFEYMHETKPKIIYVSRNEMKPK